MKLSDRRRAKRDRWLPLNLPIYLFIRTQCAPAGYYPFGRPRTTTIALSLF